LTYEVRRLTLILTYVSDRFVVHVSDRLVSRPNDRWDPTANKTVVFRAQDAIGTIGYTGDAYLGNIPTDGFIAELLSGFTFDHYGRTGNLTGMKAPLRDLAATLRSLRAAIAREFRFPNMIRRRGPPFALSIGGWEWGNGIQPRPFLASIYKAPKEWQAVLSEHDIPLESGRALDAIPEGNLTGGDSEAIVDALRMTRSPDEVERVLVNAVREVSNRAPTYVGPDCMSVVIPRLSLIRAKAGFLSAFLAESPPATIRVRSINIHDPSVMLESVSTKTREIVGPGSFCPWIVGPGGAISPQILTGRYRADVLGVSVGFDAPIPSFAGRLRGAMGSVPRKRPPA
jgi:hypothetical protein